MELITAPNVVVGYREEMEKARHIVVCRGLIRTLESKDNRKYDASNYKRMISCESE